MALDIAANRVAKAAGGEAASSSFLVSPVIMPAQKSAKPVSVEEAAAALGAEDSPLKISVTVRTVKVERVAFETKTEKDASLMLGTSIIRNLGRDGLVRTEFDTLVRDGEAGEAVKASEATVRESVAREIVLGKEPVARPWQNPGQE